MDRIKEISEAKRKNLRKIIINCKRVNHAIRCEARKDIKSLS